MSKAMFGIAAALALVVSSAWAEDEESGQVTRNTVASSDIGSESTVANEGNGASGSEGGAAVEPGRGSDTMKESKEVRASHEQERWLREREGYRDGGY